MPEEWHHQLKNFVNSLERLEQFVRLTPAETDAIQNTTSTWGTPPTSPP
jgi:lysine 2,3-aminomutase